MSQLNKAFKLDWEPAQYFSTSKLSYVQYRIYDPTTGELVRKRIKLNRIKNTRLRKQYAMQLIRELNEKLANGWNPIIEQEAPKAFYQLMDVIPIFLETKKRELRENSIRTYATYCHYLMKWLEDNQRADLIVINFKKKDALLLLNSLYLSSKYTPRSYNNYLVGYKTIWNWMIEQQYSNANPFKGIRKKKTETKKRGIIPESVRLKLRGHLEKNDLPFLIVCLLIFYCLIRPNEICQLRLENIDVSNQMIYIPASVSKNGKGEAVTIPNAVLPLIHSYLKSTHCPKHYYLISDIRFLNPGKQKLDSRELTRRWAKLRKTIDLPDHMQMYSLKDSGIVQLLKDGVPPNEVMKQARHSSLEITTAYLVHAGLGANESVKQNASGF